MIPMKHVKFLAKLGLLATSIGISYATYYYFGGDNPISDGVEKFAEYQLDLKPGTLDEIVDELAE